MEEKNKTLNNPESNDTPSQSTQATGDHHHHDESVHHHHHYDESSSHHHHHHHHHDGNEETDDFTAALERKKSIKRKVNILYYVLWVIAIIILGIIAYIYTVQ